MQDLGVFAYRIIGQESISSGSAVDFVHSIQSSKDHNDTAIVIANPGQLIWHRRGQRALTLASWSGLPRKTGVSNPMKIDPVKNHIQGNYDAKEHVECVFEAIAKLAREGVKINIIGISEGAEYAVQYLEREWERWETKVQAICVGLGFVWRVGEEIENKRFMHFWGRVSQIPNNCLCWIFPLTVVHFSAPAPISSTLSPSTPHSMAAKRLAATVSPLGNRLLQSALCRGRTRAC